MKFHFIYHSINDKNNKKKKRKRKEKDKSINNYSKKLSFDF